MEVGAEVTLDRVTKTFDEGRIRALDGVSFHIAASEFVALTGPSGCGKSTLLNLVGMLDRPDDGSIWVDGERLDDVSDPAEYRASTVGFVFQLHLLLTQLTAFENVQVPMIGRGLTRRAREGRAAELLEEVGLLERRDARPGTLSGGERQRVALARALANQPRLLLADEPTGALDAGTREHILTLLDRIRQTHGTTVLMVTNDDVSAEAADRTLSLRDGVIRAAAPRSA